MIAAPRSRVLSRVVSSSCWAIGARISSASAMPAWRTESSSAASRPSRSGSTLPERAGSARPMPTPTTSWGAIVQATEAVGTKASDPVPAATSSAPPAASTGGGPAMRVAASAASGITLTASAALSGSMPQPVISNRTTRNSAAAIAPETSPRASARPTAQRGRSRTAGTAGPGSPRSARLRRRPRRRPGRIPGRSSAPSAAGRAISTAGAWNRKIERQPKAWVSAPPMAGPAAVPRRAASRHSCGLREEPGSPGRPVSSA